MANTGLGGRGANWLSKVIDTLKIVPSVSNIVFAVVLVCLEKLVETEFSCPCDHGWNIAVVVLYFLVPAFLTFMLMCFMLEFWDKNNCCCDCDKKKCCYNCDGNKWCSGLRSTFICSIPAIVWVTLLFLDGRYVACAATDWSGRYVTTDKNVNKKWCEPTNSSLTELRTTQRLFGVSQVIGLGVLGVIIVLILIYKCSRMCCCEASGEDSIETLHGKLQEIKEAAKELEDTAKSTRAAAEAVVNESAVKTAEAVKELAAAAEAAATSAKTVVAAAAKATAATESAGAEAGAGAGAGEDSIETLHGKLQEIEKAAKELEDAAESTRAAAEKAGNESAVKRAEAVKELAAAAEAAETAAKTVVAAAAKATAATESAGEVVPLIDTSGHTQSATQQQQSTPAAATPSTSGHRDPQEPVTSENESAHELD